MRAKASCQVDRISDHRFFGALAQTDADDHHDAGIDADSSPRCGCCWLKFSLMVPKKCIISIAVFNALRDMFSNRSGAPKNTVTSSTGSSTLISEKPRMLANRMLMVRFSRKPPGSAKCSAFFINSWITRGECNCSITALSRCCSSLRRSNRGLLMVMAALLANIEINW
jgi:hypothetical protein